MEGIVGSREFRMFGEWRIVCCSIGFLSMVVSKVGKIR